MLTFTIHNLQSLCDYLSSLQQLHKVNKITLIFIDEKTVVPRNLSRAVVLSQGDFAP